MKLNKRNLEPLGFRSGLLTGATSLALHWRTRNDRVEFCDGISKRIGVFTLSSKDMGLFHKDQIVLVPPGCCAPMAGQRRVIKDCTILFEGEPRSKKHVEKILDA